MKVCVHVCVHALHNVTTFLFSRGPFLCSCQYLTVLQVCLLLSACLSSYQQHVSHCFLCHSVCGGDNKPWRQTAQLLLISTRNLCLKVTSFSHIIWFCGYMWVCAKTLSVHCCLHKNKTCPVTNIWKGIQRKHHFFLFTLHVSETMSGVSSLLHKEIISLTFSHYIYFHNVL